VIRGKKERIRAAEKEESVLRKRGTYNGRSTKNKENGRGIFGLLQRNKRRVIRLPSRETQGSVPKKKRERGESTKKRGEGEGNRGKKGAAGNSRKEGGTVVGGPTRPGTRQERDQGGEG